MTDFDDDYAARGDELRSERKHNPIVDDNGDRIGLDLVQDRRAKSYDLFFKVELPADSTLKGKDLLEIMEHAFQQFDDITPVAAQARENLPVHITTPPPSADPLGDARRAVEGTARYGASD